MAKIITVTNHKGGVGKTTTVINVSEYLLEHFKKILILDLDPQAHTSFVLTKLANTDNFKIEALLNLVYRKDINYNDETERQVINAHINEAKIKLYDNKEEGKEYSVITSSFALARAKMELAGQKAIENKLVELIRFISNGYDLVLIDTPPSLELLTFAAVASSDYILMPIQLDHFSINGANDVIREILPPVIKYFNPNLKILGVLINTYEGHTIMDRCSIEHAEEVFTKYLFKTRIKKSVRIRELTGLRSTIKRTSPKTKSGEEFRALAAEIADRINNEGV